MRLYYSTAVLLVVNLLSIGGSVTAYCWQQYALTVYYVYVVLHHMLVLLQQQCHGGVCSFAAAQHRLNQPVSCCTITYNCYSIYVYIILSIYYQ